MSIIDKITSLGINIKSHTSGEIKTTCPKCSSTRKKQSYPCLNVNIDTGVYHCWHCGWSGAVSSGQWQRPDVAKRYIRPRATPSAIAQNWIAWLDSRGIRLTTAERHKVSSGVVWMPQVEKEVDSIQFPYHRNGELINIKYRDINKNFRMASGAERILYGLDQIGKSADGSACDYLIWVEGEIDRLTVDQAGFTSCVSVPDGAPAVNTKNYSSKFDFLETAQDQINAIRRHIIAVDNDEPGRKLQGELVRRIGPDRCWIVTWPEGLKDANEVLTSLGEEAVVYAIDNAKPSPVEGIFHVSDIEGEIWGLYQDGVVKGHRIGWRCIDDLYTVRPGEWSVVTGVPGHGKSEWLDAAMVNLAIYHGWRFAICSPENQPLKLHFQKISEKAIGKPFGAGPNERMTPAEVQTAIDWVGQHFTFILPAEPKLETILELAKCEIARYGINGLVIDPWNELDHGRPSGLSETEYISQSLSTLRRFARAHQIHLWIVAHPTKIAKDKDGKYPVPTLYDIAGSAHWRNKADNGICIWREVGTGTSDVDVHVQKVRFKCVGRVGSARLRYDIITGQYHDPKWARNTNEESSR